MARRYEDRVDIVGVSGRDTVDAMRRFVSKYELPFPSVADTDEVLWDRARVIGQPAWVFVDPRGRSRVLYRPSDQVVRRELKRLSKQ